MILAFEMTWTGRHHAPGNSATLQTVALAFPDHELHVFAAQSHLSELQKDDKLVARSNVRFFAITVSSHYQFRTQIVSTRRFIRELTSLWMGLRSLRRDENCMVILLSATPTAIFAASWLSRLRGRRTAVHVVLHGNLNDMSGWRPRNPLTRSFDLRSALMARHPPGLCFLVLEAPIREELAKEIPSAAQRTRVLPLPMNLAEFPDSPPVQLDTPLRIGFVGLATQAKGIDFFLDVAHDFKSRYPGRVEFYLVGSAFPGEDLARFAVLENKATDSRLSRADFIDLLAPLHFAFLPYRHGYYERSASGALIDAITWLKPIIARRLPIVEQLFGGFGDVGYLCDEDSDMRQALETVLARMDRDRYDRQIAALRMARASRTPEALAGDYRVALTAGFRQSDAEL